MKYLLLLLISFNVYPNDVEELQQRYDYMNNQDLTDEQKKQVQEFMDMAKDHQGDIQELMKKMKDVQGMQVDPEMMEKMKGELFNLQGGGEPAPAVNQEEVLQDIECQIDPENC